MNHRDLWFVGLLTLAYIYLDGIATGATRRAAPAPLEALPDEPPAPDAGPVTDACPRDLAHPISLRGDGAMWCRACDEGFFPAVMVI